MLARNCTMKYLVYDKYKTLLEIFESKSIKDYKELEETIMGFLINNDKEIIEKVHITMNIKIHQIEELLEKLNVEVSSKKISDYYFKNEFGDEYKRLLKEKSKKIINALNLVNFTRINTISFHIYTFDDAKILSPSYYKVKEYYENKANESKEGICTSFISNFGKTLEKITKEELEYINECIAIEATNNTESSITISLESLKEIRFKWYVILTLDKNNISTESYGKRRTTYSNLIEKVYLYGIKPPDNLLFNNPTELFAEIDFILTSTGLNDKQKTLFYRELNIREKAPKSNNVKDVFEILEERILYNEVANYSYEQQEAILNNLEDFDFSEDYYKHIDKYGKDKVSDTVFVIQNIMADYKSDAESFFNYIHKNNKKVLPHLFTSTSKFRIPHLFDLDDNILK